MQKIQCIVFILILLQGIALGGNKTQINRIDPPHWYVGMKHPKLQLLVYVQNMEECTIETNYNGLTILSVEYEVNKAYIIINLNLGDNLKEGVAKFQLKKGKKIIANFDYAFKNRNSLAPKLGFDASDVIYLLMPDRFANGDTLNDNISGMLEKANRLNPDGRHGGDLKGISDHLDYFSNLGVTALWLNPVLENNNPAYSYHGYAITDFYNIDPRFGNNEQYTRLVENAHQKGLKIVMDMVFNHASIHGQLFKNPPDSNWINHHPQFTRSNFRASTICDPYASDFDKNQMLTGWFDNHMADLNQKNENLMQYLVQNSIWWIEYSGIDAIRMDTWPYPNKEEMALWASRVKEEYPSFTILGETWEQTIPTTAYWQEDSPLQHDFKSGINTITDFPMFYAISNAFNEQNGWTQGLLRLYYHMAQDFVYGDASKIVAFADNHDLNRLAETYNGDLNKIKSALVFLLTTNRIPQIYYGTEIAMRGQEHKGHGYIRQDFPGGWKNDEISVFENKNLNPDQLEMMTFLRTILQWRKGCKAVHSGKFIHFVPRDDVYVYFRYNEDKTIMVAINHSDSPKKINLNQFNEVTGKFKTLKSVLENKISDKTEEIIIQPESALILELEE